VGRDRLGLRLNQSKSFCYDGAVDMENPSEGKVGSDVLDANVNTTELSKMLVDLVMNQDHVAQNWIKFLITIEAGLAIAFAFAFGRVLPNWFQTLAILVIPVMGGALAISLAFIVVRERQWQNHYINRFNILPGLSGVVFPTRADELGSDVGKTGLGAISWSVIFLVAVITLAWFFALVVAWKHITELSLPREWLG
jgi:hypothetical protein